VRDPEIGGPSLAAAYAECERLAREHYENFPVASLALPRRMRPHVAAVYAFARTADDFADEGDRSEVERRRLLDAWLRQLGAAASGRRIPVEPGLPSATAAMFDALGHTMRECRLPASLFEDLISAFRQDTMTSRYETWDALLDYCRRSANPIGRLVLRIAGHRDEAFEASSDALCTALQLTNFWQDLERDWSKGRLYVPLADLEAAGASIGDLDRRALGPGWAEALAGVATRTRALFAQGRGVCDGVGGRLRYELRLTWLGGTTILDRLESSGFDVFAARPSLRARDAVPLMGRALAWRARPRESTGS
jgi:squalene synthase HpnC